jgi:hypothetical protein
MGKPAKTPGIEIRTTGDDVLVHDPAHEKVHVLNKTAGLVLELCDGEHSPSEIARSLSDATGAQMSLVTRDVEAVLHDFFALKLLSEV